MDKRLLEELESVNTQDEFLDIILKICLKEYMEATKPLLYLLDFAHWGSWPLLGIELWLEEIGSHRYYVPYVPLLGPLCLL